MGGWPVLCPNTGLQGRIHGVPRFECARGTNANISAIPLWGVCNGKGISFLEPSFPDNFFDLR